MQPIFKISSALFIFILLLAGCNNNPKQAEPQPKKDSLPSKTVTKVDSAKQKEIADSIKDAANEEAYEQSFILNNYIVNNPPLAQVQTIDSDAAVFVSPDSVQMEEMEKEDGEDFGTVADDASYYNSQGTQLFDSLKVKTVEPEKRYLKFVSKQKTIYFDTRAKASEGWIAILFRTDSLPRIISAPSLVTDSALQHYFVRK